MNTETNPMEEMKSLLQQIQWSNRELITDCQKASTEIKTLGASHQKLATDFAEAQKNLEQLRRVGLAATPKRLAHQAVSDDCARYIAAIVVCGADSIGGLNHIKGAQRDTLVGECKNILGLETRSALTSSDIPLPTMYSS